VGTRDGLNQLSDLKFPLFTEKEGIVAGSVHMVATARDGGIWITSTQGVCHFDGKSAKDFTSDAVLTTHYVKLVAEARNGDLYLADGNRNLNVMSGGRLAARYACERWPEAIAEDDESMIVGLGQTLWRVRGQGLEPCHFAEGQDAGFKWFQHMCVASDGAIWIPSYVGIFRVKDGRTRKFEVPNWRAEDRLYFIMEDADGSIWVSGSVGLVRVKNGQLKRITEKDGLYDGMINAIVADDHGYFWMDSGRGIYRVARRSLNDFADGRIPAVQCEGFEGLDAAKSTDRTDQLYSGCKTPDGRIWFPNARGVLMIDPANFFTNKIAPPVHIEQVRVDGATRRERGRAVLPAGTERVEFSFAALSFIAPQKVSIQYQLEGLDKAWVDAGARRSVLYNNLRHGRYTFRVRGCNADGMWDTADAAFSIELQPFFYETPWFYASCGLAGVAVLLASYRWKVRLMVLRQRKLQAANDLLEAKVAERTHELSHERDLLRTLLENSHDSIFFKDTQSRFVKAGRALAAGLGVKSPDDLIGRTDADFLSAEHARQSADDEQEIMRTGRPMLDKIEHSVHPDGHQLWVLTSKMPWRGKNGEIVGTFGISKDISAIKEAERKLVDLHKQLLETSREAGMAEVATSVLHNVGNVLNSVNVSVTLVAERVRTSRVSFLPKISALLQEHSANLAEFLVADPKGRAIVPYLVMLGEELASERDMLIAELDGLRKNTDHIKEIVATQQGYAKVSGIVETVPLIEIVEDAIRMNSGALERHQVTLVRDYLGKPVLTLERHKVMQVLVNLIRNAKYACDDSSRPDKQITIRVVEDGEWVRLSVIDNGVGIPPENLTRIFEHGFTTRKSGHGFGLHSGSLVAKELGGTLTVHSDGPGAGAVFTINLPRSTPRK
jgi:PAS domain S-box-containing protein